MKKTFFVAGAGGIGEAAALLLREWSAFDVEIILGDISERTLNHAMEFVTGGSQKASDVTAVMMPSDGVSDDLKSAFERSDVLLDCTPGSLAPKMAGYAKEFRMHYANLTEYVAETDEIIRLAEDAETGFVLQTGLAPGFVNVLAMSLYRRFVSKYENESVERIAMKVGALTAHAHAPFFYGFTWSPIGVATEYVKNSRVIREHEITSVPALSDRERIIIGARSYEADLTSGGAADLPDYFEGKARELDYKTIRYPGHYDWVESVEKSLPKDAELPKRLEAVMLETIPSVEDDVVLVHASVDGFDSGGRRRMVEKAFYVEPLEINGKHLRAIQTTTAAPLCEAAMMLVKDERKGVILQSQIDSEQFMKGTFVSSVYK